MEDQDRDVRLEVITKTMQQLIFDAEVFASCLRAICSDHVKMMKRRKYLHPIEPNFIYNDITREMADAMTSAIESNLDIFHEFLKLKATTLGTEKLLGQDLWAPFPVSDAADRKYSWEEACKIVGDFFNHFDPEFGEFSRDMFSKGRVDASPRKGKESGAFCSTDNKNKSAFILQSFTGNEGDVTTLAHEMGHAIHAYFLTRNQSYF